MRIAPGRDKRPSDFAEHDERRCPFCAGSEADTPPELDRLAGGESGWLTRVVPNRYPAFEGADGQHEVIIESPRHVTRFVDLTNEEAASAVQMWARRIAKWRAESGYDYQLVFKNEGVGAGASLEHVHSQVVTLPKAPSLGDAPIRGDLIVHQANGWRIAASSVPRFAFESVICPEDSTHDFASLANDAEVAGRLAAVIAQTLVALRSVTDVAAYNLMVNTPGEGMPWWIDITPRSAVTAGFELATRMWINAFSPEAAAERLRAVMEADQSGIRDGQASRSGC